MASFLSWTVKIWSASGVTHEVVIASGKSSRTFLCVVDHRYLCNAWLGEIEVHSKVVVDWATMDNKAVAIYCCKIGCKFCDLEGVDV